MKLTKAQQKIVLVVLVALLVLINGYLYLNGEKPKTAPLTFTRGTIAVSPVRQGPSSQVAGADPLNIFLERRREKFPGVVRDIFRMEDPVPKPKAPIKPVAPPVHVKTQEEIDAEAFQAAVAAAQAAAEAATQAARADLMKFQVLGYLTDKESTLFLSKEGELFTVKKGSDLLKSYKVKDASNNYVILLDTITGVEVQLDLPGGETSPKQESQQQPIQKKRQSAPERSVDTMPQEPPDVMIPTQPGDLQQQFMRRWQQQKGLESGDGTGTPDTSGGTISPQLPQNQQPAQMRQQRRPKVAPAPAPEKWLNE